MHCKPGSVWRGGDANNGGQNAQFGVKDTHDHHHSGQHQYMTRLAKKLDLMSGQAETDITQARGRTDGSQPRRGDKQTSVNCPQKLSSSALSFGESKHNVELSCRGRGIIGKKETNVSSEQQSTRKVRKSGVQARSATSTRRTAMLHNMTMAAGTCRPARRGTDRAQVVPDVKPNKECPSDKISSDTSLTTKAKLRTENPPTQTSGGVHYRDARGVRNERAENCDVLKGCKHKGQRKADVRNDFKGGKRSSRRMITPALESAQHGVDEHIEGKISGGLKSKGSTDKARKGSTTEGKVDCNEPENGQPERVGRQNSSARCVQSECRAVLSPAEPMTLVMSTHRDSFGHLVKIRKPACRCSGFFSALDDTENDGSQQDDEPFMVHYRISTLHLVKRFLEFHETHPVPSFPTPLPPHGVGVAEMLSSTIAEEDVQLVLSQRGRDLFELLEAADFLQIQSLFELASWRIAWEWKQQSLEDLENIEEYVTHLDQSDCGSLSAPLPEVSCVNGSRKKKKRGRSRLLTTAAAKRRAVGESPFQMDNRSRSVLSKMEESSGNKLNRSGNSASPLYDVLTPSLQHEGKDSDRNLFSPRHGFINSLPQPPSSANARLAPQELVTPSSSDSLHLEAVYDDCIDDGNSGITPGLNSLKIESFRLPDADSDGDQDKTKLSHVSSIYATPLRGPPSHRATQGCVMNKGGSVPCKVVFSPYDLPERDVEAEIHQLELIRAQIEATALQQQSGSSSLPTLDDIDLGANLVQFEY